MNLQPIFLVGVPRSGTTMLRLVLGSHPSVYSTVELPWIGGNYFSDGYGPEVSVRCLYQRLANASMQTCSDHLERIKSACRSFVEQVCRTAMTEGNKTVWVEKTPDNIIQLPFLAELFPDARFLRVIRDGRDVALSTLNVDWRALNYFLDWTPQQLRWINLRLALQRRFRNHLPLSLQEFFLRAPAHAQNLRAPTILFPAANTFYNALYRWQVWNELYDRYAAELGVPQLTVRYEDLLLDQQGTFPEIFKFIGARWDDRVLNYGQYRHDLRPGDVGGSSAMRFERVAPENAYTWKMRLTRHQRRLVRARFDHYLVAAGYERTPQS